MSDDTPSKETPATAGPQITLGHWSLYFLAKIFLYLREFIGLHALHNLAFAAFLLIPIRNRWLRIVRALVSIPVAVALLYYDSWLPPFHRLLSESNLIAHFDLVYLGELFSRFINLDVVAALVLMSAVYFLVTRYIRVGVLVMSFLVFAATPWHGLLNATESEPVTVATMASDAPTAALQDGNDLNQYLNAFYAAEKKRQANFTPPADSDVPFDILFLHVCSLSWDDIAYAQQQESMPTFDILLRNFNTAASYSGPAVIRILRASCGQSRHSDLYSPAPQQCYLFDQLAALGFEKQLALNHDGHFDDFLGVIRERGHLAAKPLSLESLKPALRSFDGSPVFDDGQVLKRWLEEREVDDAARVATLYNTVTLHDGNRYTDHRSHMNSLENFTPRMQGLFGELKTFFRQLEESGRRVLVVMIPEHGAAARGDKLQIAGLREIPSPSITLAPVGLRLFGPGMHPHSTPVTVNQPTSHLDVSNLVASLIASNPFGPAGYHPVELARKVGETAFVAENAGTVVIRHRGRYYVRLEGSKDWAPYPANKR